MRTARVGATYTLSAVSNNPTKISVSDGVNTQLVTLSALSAGQNTLTLGSTGLTIGLSASGSLTAEALANDLTKAGQNTVIVTGATGGANLQVGANQTLYDQMSISFNDIRASQPTGLNLLNQNVTAIQATALSATTAVDFTTNNVVGWLSALTHSNSAGLYLFAVVMAVSGALILAIPARLVNK